MKCLFCDTNALGAVVSPTGMTPLCEEHMRQLAPSDQVEELLAQRDDLVAELAERAKLVGQPDWEGMANCSGHCHSSSQPTVGACVVMLGGDKAGLDFPIFGVVREVRPGKVIVDGHVHGRDPEEYILTTCRFIGEISASNMTSAAQLGWDVSSATVIDWVETQRASTEQVTRN